MRGGGEAPQGGHRTRRSFPKGEQHTGETLPSGGKERNAKIKNPFSFGPSTRVGRSYLTAPGVSIKES